MSKLAPASPARWPSAVGRRARDLRTSMWGMALWSGAIVGVVGWLGSCETNPPFAKPNSAA